MLVREWMSTTVITVDPAASISEAIELLDRHHISMLPVVRVEKLVGIITNADLKPFHSTLPAGGFLGPVVLTRIRVEDIMCRAPVTVPVDFTVEETADVLLKNGCSGVAVVDEQNKIVGVMTQTDINRVLVSVTGLWRGGIVFGFLLEDTPGSIRELTDVLRSYGGRLASILSSYERSPKGYRRVHIRVRGLERTKLAQLEQELQAKAKLLYWVDQRENKRKMGIELLSTERVAKK
jgi:acetoin utilization protein AcuB